MKKLILSIFVLSLFISACSNPFDTDSNMPTIEPATNNNDDEQNVTAPLFLTTMTHMEASFTDDKVQTVFEKHIGVLTATMDLADEYNAIITVETEKPFAKANEIWGKNFMKEILDRGHGVGTHCDVGGSKQDKGISTDALAAQMTENKSLVDSLVGEKNNLGCSGGAGTSDWITSAQKAGFTYINGIVGMHMLAIPEKERPDNGKWTNKYILGEGFHQNVPTNLEDRIYFTTLKDAKDFKEDKSGLVISNGELGALAGLYENKMDVECSGNTCTLTNEDVDTLIETIKEVDSFRDKTRPAKLTVYLPTSLLEESKNEESLRYFFSETKLLQDEGLMEWSSQANAVKTYIDYRDGITADSTLDKTVYTDFVINVHDWTNPQKSTETLNKIIDLHEEYRVPVDIFLDDQITQFYVDESPELLDRLKTSKYVAVSYHLRPPYPYYWGYDWYGLTNLNKTELTELILNYEEHKIDLLTGKPTDEPGGYQYLKDLMGYAPYTAVVMGNPEVLPILAKIYKDKGALITLTHNGTTAWGEVQNGLFMRPEDLEVKVYEGGGSKKSGEEILSESLTALGPNRPAFMNLKWHENDFYTSETPWWPVYWTDNEERGLLYPPYDISKAMSGIKEKTQKTADIQWTRYEECLSYISSHPETFTAINAKDLVGMFEG
ncbi:MAG: hypothetical protein WC846_05190 [Candidatus Gracilibacteria bacterium]|jgi:hypothetical protein